MAKGLFAHLGIGRFPNWLFSWYYNWLNGRLDTWNDKWFIRGLFGGVT